ncbi:MAG: O-antigen ligase family protein, partial [Verrucomicrobiota bacterium]
ALAPLAFDTSLYQVSDLPKETILNVGIGLLVAVLALRHFFIRSILNFPLSLGSLMPLMLVVLGAVSILWSHNHHLAFGQLLLWLATFLFFYLVLTGMPDSRCIVILLSGFVLGAVFNAILGLYQLWSGDIPDYVFSAPAGTFVNKNVAAQIAVLALPIALGGMLLFQRKPMTALAACGTVILALFVFHAFSRASWLAGLMALLFLITAATIHPRLRKLFRRRLQRWRLTLVGVSALLFVVGANVTSEGFNWRFGEAWNDALEATHINTQGDRLLQRSEGSTGMSVSSRIGMWRNALVLLSDSMPLGVGEGNFEVAFPPYANTAVLTPFDTFSQNLRYAHNDYLEFAIEYGLLGVVIACLFFASLLRAVFATFARGGENALMLTTVLCASLLALAVTACFSAPMLWPLPRYGFALFTAVIFSLSPRQLPTFRVPLGRVAGLVIAVFAIALICVSVVRYLHEREGQAYLREAMENYQKGDFLLADKLAAKATAMLPYDQQARMFYGAMLLAEERNEEALAQMEILADLYPYDVRNNLNRALAYERLGMMDAAIANYRILLDVRPYDVQSAYKLAEIYRQRGDGESEAGVMQALAEAQARMQGN